MTTGESVNEERMTIGLGATMKEWVEKQAAAKQRPQAWIIRECVEMCMRHEAEASARSKKQ